MINKKITILVLILVVMAVVSGCWKKDVVISNNENNSTVIQATSSEKIIPKEEINYLKNGEIDISDWLTYRDEFYKIEIKYPPFLEITNMNKYCFGWKYAVDYSFNRAWHFSCTGQPVGSYLFKMTLDERKEHIKDSYQNKIDYNEFAFNEGVMYYGEDDITKGDVNFHSYLISTMIFIDKDRILYSNEESLLYCGNDIDILYKDEIEKEIKNDKYGKVIKTMLKSIKYID